MGFDKETTDAAEKRLREILSVGDLLDALVASARTAEDYTKCVESIIAEDLVETTMCIHEATESDEDRGTVLRYVKILIPLFVEFSEEGDAHELVKLKQIAVSHILRGYGDTVPYLMIHDLVRAAHNYAQRHVRRLQSSAESAIMELRMNGDTEVLHHIARVAHEAVIMSVSKKNDPSASELTLYKKHTVLAALTEADSELWNSSFNEEILKKYNF